MKRMPFIIFFFLYIANKQRNKNNLLLLECDHLSPPPCKQRIKRLRDFIVRKRGSEKVIYRKRDSSYIKIEKSCKTPPATSPKPTKHRHRLLVSPVLPCTRQRTVTTGSNSRRMRGSKRYQPTLSSCKQWEILERCRNLSKIEQLLDSTQKKKT